MTAGETGHGVRRMIPIVGGDVRGPDVNGKVCPFGADFQIIRPNELIELEAKYAFETDDGAIVYVENKGIRFGPLDLLHRLKRGEPVDPELIYFRTIPKFETGHDKYAADGDISSGPLRATPTGLSSTCIRCCDFWLSPRRPGPSPAADLFAEGDCNGLTTDPAEGRSLCRDDVATLAD